jgi:microcystin-dependent protein
MANWINGAINSGYTAVSGSLTGAANSKVACWVEYRLISQSIVSNTSTIRLYAYIATAQNTSQYWTYWNNHSGDSRGMFKIYAAGSLVYERVNRGFATSNIPTPSDFTTQYETEYVNAEGRKFLTVLTDNASTRAAAYGDFTIAHNADGTRQFTLSFNGDFSIASSFGTASGSVTIQLPTIPRSTVPYVGSVTLGSAATISIYPASSSFRHTFRAQFGSRAQTTIATLTSATSISWTPSLAEANAAPNATTVAGTLYCDTYSGSTLLGTCAISVSAAIPASVTPTLTYTMSEAVSGIASRFGAYIQGNSKLAVSITPSGAYGSTVSSVTTTVNGTTYTTTSFTTAVLQSAGSQTMRITVKDSRNRTATYTASFSVTAYAAPKLTNVAIYRCNSNGAASHTGAYMSVTFTGQVTSLNSRNTVAFAVGYKLKTASSYTNTTLGTSGYSVSGTFIVGGSLSNQAAYDIRLGATDFFSTTYAYSDISTADTILSIRNNGLGMAIGKVSEANKFEVGWQAQFHEDVQFDGDVSFSSLGWLLDVIFPIGSIRMTTTTTGAANFLGGTWAQWGTGRVPVGVNTSDSNFNTVEKTGGASTVALSTAQLPSHGHTVTGSVSVGYEGSHTHRGSTGAYKVGSGSGSSYYYMTNNGATNGQTTGAGSSHNHSASFSGSAGNTGSGSAHNNLQPYITCYFWKRTA